MRGNFTGVPLVIGEYESSMQCEPAARRKWTDMVIKTANKYNMTTMLWDNGLGLVDRVNHDLRDPAEMSIILSGANGLSNSLSDSTTDASTTTRFTSAYIFNRVNQTPTDQSLPFQLNGNTLASVVTSDGTILQTPADYIVEGSDITFTSSFLNTIVPATADAGSKVNLTLTFSSGANASVEIVQWDVPVFEPPLPAPAQNDTQQAIPITWKGLNKLAAVMILMEDGTPLFDSWTEFLGPMSSGRGVRVFRMAVEILIS